MGIQIILRRSAFLLGIAGLCFFTSPTVQSRQTVVSVCASGCTYTSLQTAINAATCNTIIELAAAETFIGNFQLTNTAVCATPITIRSSAWNNPSFPAAGVRAGVGRTLTINQQTITTPDHRALMPNVQASSGGLPAIRTAAGARDYSFLGIEFLGNPGGFGVVLELGVNTVAQRAVSEQPSNIAFDRVIVSADPLVGQKVGIDMNGANISIVNSWLEHITGLGQDAIACRAINGTGPLLVENNFLEGAAENCIIGGDDPWMMTSADVNAGATTTQATLSNFADRAGTAYGSITSLKVGQRISFLAGTNTVRYPTFVRSCGSGTTTGTPCSSNTITYDAIPAAPDTGTAGDARWGDGIPTGITFRRNLVYKNPEWRNTVIGALGTVTVTASTTGGTLAAGTYYYRVTPLRTGSYNGNNAYGTTSVEVSVPTTGTTSSVQLSWPEVPNATHYRVYRGTAAGTYTGYLLATGVTTLTDTGGALTSASIPGASRWVVKTNFELKFGMDVLVEGNIFENNWGGQGDAYGQCAWIKSNTLGACEFCETRNLTWRYNICRNVNGYFNFLDSNMTGANKAVPLNNVTIVDSLFQGSSTANGPSVDAVRISGQVANLTLNHNTFTSSARGFVYFTGAPPTPGFVAKNNAATAQSYSFFGSSCTNGTSCLDRHAAGWQVNDNALAAASASANPTDNLYPTLTVFGTNFENFDNGLYGNYLLTPESTWRNAGDDGADIGANMTALYSAVSSVPQGVPPGATPPPTITTVGLPNGTVGTVYNAGLSALDGVPPYTWALVAGQGTLPAGLTLSTGGVISGTPSATGTSNFVVRVTDSTAGTPRTDDQALSLTIVAAPVALNITTTTLPNATIPTSYNQTLAAVGGTTPYTWSLSSGALPAGLTLDPATGVISGVPTTPGTANFVAQVTGAAGAVDTQSLAILVVEAARPCNRPASSGFSDIKLFEGSVAPVAAFPDCAYINDLWLNTSTSPAELYIASTTVPNWVPWLASSGQTAHDLLEHADTVTDVPAEGALIVGNESNQWSLLSGGNGFLQQQNGAFSYTFNGSQLTNISESALPSEFTRTRVNAGILGSSNYIAFTATANPGAPSSAIYGRIYYDSATSQFRAWENGVNVDLIGGGSATWTPDDMMIAASVTTSNVPAGGAELGAATRFRARKDVQGFTQVALIFSVQTPCFTGADLQIQYWDGSAWQSIAGLVADCDTTANSLYEGTFVTLPTGARTAGQIFRGFITTGDGVVDPNLNSVRLNFRP